MTDQPHAYERSRMDRRCIHCNGYSGNPLHSAPRIPRSPLADAAVVRDAVARTDVPPGHVNPEWWKADYFHGYRAHLPHPMMNSTGSEGRCDICGRSSTRDHEEPHQRITFWEWLDERAREHNPDLDERPRPVFTDTRPAARLERMKAPAVSSELRGEIENRPEVVRIHDEAEPGGQGFSSSSYFKQAKAAEAMWPHIQSLLEGGNPLNLNITTEPGKVKAHRAIVSTSDGTQGVFAEADELVAAIGQVIGSVQRGTTVSVYAGVEPEPTASDSAPVPRTVYGSHDAKHLIRDAMAKDQTVELRYDGMSMGQARKVVVTPLYDTEDGLVFAAKQEGLGIRNFRYSRVRHARVVA